MQPLPAPALGRDFQVLSEPDVMSIKAPALGRHGNVRELENVIQSAIICANTDVIEANDLPKCFRKPDLAGDSELPQVGSLERLLRARRLRMSPAYLHRLIRLPEEPEAADVA